MAIQVTKEIYSFLVQHILDMRDRKISIANNFSMDYEKYVNILSFLNSYIKSVEAFLEKVDIINGVHTPPFVIIGSVVEVLDMRQKKHSFIIMAPGKSSRYDQANDGYETLSCLSDAGRSLLLKKRGQELTINKPDGQLVGTIERICFNMEGTY
ncbi:MAG: hypothetical protein PHO15_00275 [Eubacteriales bacterium]|nr:hypothetical protein [Eubacteriales bacterium]